jgi:hypothetical protein
VSLEIDITPDPGNEIATTRTVSRYQGYIELHTKTSRGYRLLGSVESGPVTRLSAVHMRPARSTEGAAPGAEGGGQELGPIWATLILAEAEYDQSVGALSKATVSTAYAWNGRQLVEVWSATTRSESVWNTGWSEGGGDLARSAWRVAAARARPARVPDEATVPATAVSAPAEWVRVVSRTEVEFQGAEVPCIVTRSVQEYQKHVEEEDTFVTVASREVSQRFCWSDRWTAFVLSEGKISREGAVAYEYPGSDVTWTLAPGLDVAVLESERNAVEGLVHDPPYLLRVRTPDGKGCYVNETCVLPHGTGGALGKLSCVESQRRGAT